MTENEKKIVVKKISAEIVEGDITEHFSKFGEIVKVNFKLAAAQEVLPLSYFKMLKLCPKFWLNKNML